ncbi:MAG: hypothetical protein LIP08_07970 [Bacteroides sp.]|nr:hypothetical protein [Bacteroides sp.]
MGFGFPGTYITVAVYYLSVVPGKACTYLIGQEGNFVDLFVTPGFGIPQIGSDVVFFLNHPSDYFRQATYAGSDRFTFSLSSGSDNRFYLQPMRLTSENYFRIDNQNGPPLKIDSVRFYGQDRYLCAYLTAGEKYTVVIDNQQCDRPTYDIEHFRNDIPSQLPVLQTTLPLVRQERVEMENRKTLWIERPIVLWSISIGVGLFLLWICWWMMKQKKR